MSSATAQTYRFDLIASGQDSGRIQHSIPVTFIAGSDFNSTNASGAQTISAGGTASYLLECRASFRIVLKQPHVYLRWFEPASPLAMCF